MQNLYAQTLRRIDVVNAMKRAATFYRESVATHGGYVYHYSVDLNRRWGEGAATVDQIWVQPPGTPTIGMAYLKAYEATGDRYYLDAAQQAAEALVYGQIQSGGWTNCIDFNPQGERVCLYRNGKGRGRNTSSLDDGQTASALLLLIRTDKALKFRHEGIHEAASFALASLLKAQYPNGAFPQVWDDAPRPADSGLASGSLKASYPNYDWKIEGRVKNYWDMYTLNDNVHGYVAETLITAFETYGEDRFLQSLRKLGDFLILAQMPEPQPGWAQQYNYEMRPIWARKFEPPAVSGDETQESIATLIRIAKATDDNKYLGPVPFAIQWLQHSKLPDGQLARYYELRTNKPLYMERNGEKYSLTYDDSNLPAHYGWKTESKIENLASAYAMALQGNPADDYDQQHGDMTELIGNVFGAISSLDKNGRWISVADGERLVGQPRIPLGEEYLSSAVFSERLQLLSEYLQRTDRSGNR